MAATPRLALLLIAPLLAAGLLLGGGAVATAQAGCKGADDYAFQTPSKGARKATLCLLNNERSRRGLPDLSAQSDLRKAAKKHTRRMIKQRCFAHTCPGEADLTKRVKATSYLSCNCSWSLGENIGYGYGSKSTPRWMVESWMDSSGHRDNILSRSFRQIGIGIKPGSPTDGPGAKAATYTTTFGSRG